MAKKIGDAGEKRSNPLSQVFARLRRGGTYRFSPRYIAIAWRGHRAIPSFSMGGVGRATNLHFDDADRRLIEQPLPKEMPVFRASWVTRVAAAALLSATVSSAGAAEPSSDSELTPMGSVAAANADGSIPAWAPLTFKGAPHNTDPYAHEKPLFTITAANASEYAALLSPAQRKRLERYASGFRMPVYPSHRGATFPDWFLQATRENEQRTKLSADGQGFMGAAKGYPFRRPKTGTEALWNHVVRYNTSGFRGYLSTAISLPGGRFDLERRYVEFAFFYNRADAQGSDNTRNLAFLSKIIDPPVKAGTGDLVRLPLNRFATAIEAWIFLPQSGRVYRGPDNGYDTPTNDGLMTFDQIDMFNGPTDRYDLELVGSREMIVPYNNYALYSDKLKYGHIIGDGYLKPEVLRYEKHRVWVIEARLKNGMKHLYGRRTLYLDEDTWGILAADLYDMSGKLIRGAESYPVPYPDQSVTLLGAQLFDDFNLGRFVLMNLTNEEDEFPQFGWRPPSNNYFMPSNLTRFTQTKHKTKG